MMAELHDAKLESLFAEAKCDLEGEAITAIHGLGTRDLNVPGQGIDASDRDDATNIRPWPVRGYFAPDHTHRS